MGLTKADFDALRDQMLAEFSRIKQVIAEKTARIEELLKQIGAGGLTAEEEAAVKADIQSELDEIKGIGVQLPSPE